MVGTLLAMSVWGWGAEGAQAQADLVVLDMTVAPPSADTANSDAPVARIDAAELRLELARTLQAFVVAANSAEAFGVPPSVVISVALSPGQASVVIQVAATPERPASQQTLAFGGELTQPRLVALLLALVGPAVNVPSSNGMDVRVNPYRDSTPARTRPEPLRPRTAVTFLVPNPYRTRDVSDTRRQPPMAISENPYR